MGRLGVRHEDLYHTGIVIDDMAAAQDELGEELGVSWGPQGTSEQPVLLADGPRTVVFRFAYSAEGPHHLELVRAVPGTLWTVTPPGHAHHLGYWCDDVPAVSAAMSERGLPLVAKVGTDRRDGDAAIVYHQARSGLYIELVDRSHQALIFGTPPGT